MIYIATMHSCMHFSYTCMIGHAGTFASYYYYTYILVILITPVIAIPHKEPNTCSARKHSLTDCLHTLKR